MVAYFCHYLSDSNVDLTDLSVDLPVFDISVDLLWGKVSKLHGVYIPVSCYIAVCPKMAYTCRHNFLTSRHNDLIS